MSRIKEYPSITSFDGTDDALAIEQTDGANNRTRKVSPAQIKQYVLGSSIDDIYSVMGQNGAKNLIPYPYNETTQVDHGVTFTVNNDDGTVIANGTANGTAEFYLVLGNLSLSAVGNLVINTNKPLFLSGCPSGGSHSTFRIQYGLTDGTTYWAKTASDIGSGVKITPVDGLNTYCFDVIKIMVFNGYTANNLTFKPMLRLASDTDNTYQPYAKTNKELTNGIDDVYKTMGEMGAKNLIPYPYYETTKTQNGVTITDNGDGTITVDTDGSASTGNVIFLCQTSNIISNLIKLDKNKTYIFSDTTKSGIANTCTLGIRYFAEGVVPSSTTGTNVGCNATNNWQVTVTNAVYAYVYVYVWSGKTIDNVTIKPMLRLASDTDNTYQPYAMTNKQLTDEIQRILNRIGEI